MPKGKKKAKETINHLKHADIDTIADISIDPRESKFEAEPNRYQKQIEQKHLEKIEREKAKQNKVHIGKRKHIEKRAKVEAELQQLE